jgi:hypothetical protein
MIRRLGVTRTEVIGDEVEGLRVVLDFGVEAGEVEPVKNVVLFYFAKVLVSLGREEPRNPGATNGIWLSFDGRRSAQSNTYLE